ncbi:MAG: HisA/HisF-related TIM barrel protein [Methanobacteriaceae archaeon]|nr:HisA/HisF-related TIM barrel protein [Methanobacteriaceae archaeon]
MIIPVLDIKNNTCVSGKSGNRNTYKKLESVYGNLPEEIVINLKKDGFKCVYIADLDMIENIGDNSKLIKKLNNILPIMLDNGIKNIEDLKKSLKNCTWSILATETIESTDTFIKIFKNHDKKRLIISIDIKNNEVLTKNNDITLKTIIDTINQIKPEKIIILNITQVGQQQSKIDQITQKIIDKTPYTTHILGGGMTNKQIQQLKEKNIKNYLIGTDLHNGNLKK